MRGPEKDGKLGGFVDCRNVFGAAADTTGDRESGKVRGTRALFCTALHRRAISWLRRGDAMVMPEGPDVPEAPSGAEEETRGFVHDALAALSALPAREFGTSPANADQIVSCVRRRLSEESE